MRKKGFTLIELLVVIAIIAMLLAILMPALSKVKKIAMQVVCGTNLKGLGTAQMVYANDYEDEYAIAGFGAVSQLAGNIQNATGGWNNPAKPLASWSGGASIGASLYLLVREADVSPKSFVCPSGSETAFDGENVVGGASLDITEMNDFGHHLAAGLAHTGPIHQVSYAYQHPYSRFSADATKSAAFAVMADKNPWQDNKITTQGGLTADTWQDSVHFLSDDITNPGANLEKFWVQAANAQPHDRNGQNVLFADGHNAFEKRSDVGVKHDAIYTPATANHIRQGGPVARAQNTANSDIPVRSSDSFLVNDSRLGDP